MEVLPYIAIAFSGVTLLILVGEKLFGGGNALAGKFHTLDKDTTTAITLLRNEMNASIMLCRNELNSKIDEYEKVSTLGFDAIRANIHAMQLGLLEFRAKMAEDLHVYIRKDDYNAGIGDVKRDVQNGFRSVDERLGQLQDLIMYANPDAAGKMTGHKRQ
jgi:hypothetical protein